MVKGIQILKHAQASKLNTHSQFCTIMNKRNPSVVYINDEKWELIKIPSVQEIHHALPEQKQASGHLKDAALDGPPRITLQTEIPKVTATAFQRGRLAMSRSLNLASKSRGRRRESTEEDSWF